jgi:hypothetical protein
VTRVAYEVRLARRQYDAVDPDNRLVAAELERRWELALRAGVEARDPHGIPKRLVATIRRTHGQPSLTEQFRRLDKLDGDWTVWGLARALGAHRNWLYKRIAWGTLPSKRHPTTGHYLVPDHPKLLEQLRAQLPHRPRT